MFNFGLRFKSVGEVSVWARKNGGEKAVRALLALERMDVPNQRVIEAWLANEDRKRQDARNATEAELRQREVLAIEASAKAAEDSAKSARQSAIWAWVGMIISVITFFLALKK